MFSPKGSHTPQLSEATLLGMFLLDQVSIGAACFPTRSQLVGSKISKGCHTQDSQSQGKALPGYQLFTAPLARPNMAQTRTQGRSRRQMSSPRPCGSLTARVIRVSGKPLITKIREVGIFKQTLIKYKLLQGHPSQGSEKGNMADMSTRSDSKVAGFWNVRVGWIL